MERVAALLHIDQTAEQLDRVVETTSFTAMRDEALASEAAAGGPGNGFFEGGVATFFHKGMNGRWRDILDGDDLAAYDRRAELLDPAFRSWLEGGRHACDPAASSPGGYQA